MSSSGARRRNPRGAGGHLRSEIVTAARELLVEAGAVDPGAGAVTLRAVARRVGVAPNSIYAHFDDPQQIVRAVIVETFGALVEHLQRARAGIADPLERLLASCRAYLDFGTRQSALYGLIFSRPSPAGRAGDGNAPTEGLSAPVDPVAAAAVDQVRARTGADAFGLLVDDVSAVIAAGGSDAHDALVTATGLWVAMHGLVLLRGSAPEFPWPEDHHLETEIVTRIGLLHSARDDQRG